MKQNPTLSIITVAAFDATRLLRTIESSRTLHGDLEHLFVVPFGDSDSLNAIAAYGKVAKIAIRVLNDKKEGIYPAMNMGAYAAQGDYILFLNAGDEIFSPEVLLENINRLTLDTPEWAITGVHLPWNSNYSSFEGMDHAFRLQKPQGYISHQSVFVKLSVFKQLNGFDTRFRIAADTRQIFQLSSQYPPHILEGIAIQVEEGFTVTSHNRESRLEVLRLINTVGNLRTIMLSNIYFFKRESIFLHRHILKLVRRLKPGGFRS